MIKYHYLISEQEITLKIMQFFISTVMSLRYFILLIIIFIFSFELSTYAQHKTQTKLPGFFLSPYFDEQIVSFLIEPEVKIHINAPSSCKFKPDKKIVIALFALPNGNTIEQTVGKTLEPGDDWHYDIQHIGGQTRFLREYSKDFNLVTVYLETFQKSWPAWKAKYSNHAQIIKKIVEYLISYFEEYDPEIVLTGHSGGGRFTFSFMDAFETIPDYVKRISFLDSNYGYEDIYGLKIANWLRSFSDNYLSVIAYNDSVALYNNAPIVSPTGGTWHKSRRMKNFLSNYFEFFDEENDEFITNTARDGRIKFILKKNPGRKILHTVQVERNGFIHGMVSGTSDENTGYSYYGPRAYSKWIQMETAAPNTLMIPLRDPNAKSGSEFMKYIMNMDFAQREDEIFKEISTGNIPNFYRNLVKIEAEFENANRSSHIIQYEVMPDYLAIGSDEDFCRIPMGPKTAQKIADIFGAVMPTRKIVDNIYLNSEIKLEPVTYYPVGNQNELVEKFVEHNEAIQKQIASANGMPGQLIGGIKKDIILSNKISDQERNHRVTIYGWHRLDGKAIQPPTNIHVDTYVDYSHGVRLLNNEILIDGEVKKVIDILKDPILYKILSDEESPMIKTYYTKDLDIN